jgi:hypothetical protein
MKERPRTLQNSSNVESTRFQKERKAKEQLPEKHINRSCRELRPIARDRRK